MKDTSPLNDAIRDVLADFASTDSGSSNRQAAEEVILRYPDVVEERSRELMINDLIKRIRELRKKPHAISASTERQLVLPQMAQDLLPRLPAEMPRYPANGTDEIAEDEIPWGSLWTSTVGELRRYAAHLLAGIRADSARLQAIREVLDMALNGGGVSDDVRVIDAVRAAVEHA